MATVHAIHSVSQSLVNYLRGTFPADLVTGTPEFRLLASRDLDSTPSITLGISLWLYRITANEHARGTVPIAGPSGAAAPLALDLHFLLTVWANDPQVEQSMLAWSMTALHQKPRLDMSMLSDRWYANPSDHPAGWRPDDVLVVVQETMSTEDLMRIWDATGTDYRVSVPYVVRVVRIDAETGIEPTWTTSIRNVHGVVDDP